jgi:hypothetical protein
VRTGNSFGKSVKNDEPNNIISCIHVYRDLVTRMIVNPLLQYVNFVRRRCVSRGSVLVGYLKYWKDGALDPAEVTYVLLSASVSIDLKADGPWYNRIVKIAH